MTKPTDFERSSQRRWQHFKTNLLIYVLLALSVATTVGTFTIAHTKATNTAADRNFIATIINKNTELQNRVIGCETLLNLGVKVKDLPVLCVAPDARKYYTPENVKPAVTDFAIGLLEFDCDIYKKLDKPQPPICNLIPPLPTK